MEAAQQHVHVVGAGAAQHHLATADRDRGQVGGGLDAVGHHLVIGGVQFAGLDAVDDQRGRADALDLGTHADEEVAQVGDLGLAGRVVDHRGALGVHRGGEDVLGGADAGELERDVGAVQALGAGLHHAVAQLERGAHRLEALEVHVDGAAAEVVAAGQRQRDPPEAAEQRAEHVDAGPDALDQLVGRDGCDVAGVDHAQLRRARRARCARRWPRAARP